LTKRSTTNDAEKPSVAIEKLENQFAENGENGASGENAENAENGENGENGASGENGENDHRLCAQSGGLAHHDDTNPLLLEEGVGDNQPACAQSDDQSGDASHPTYSWPIRSAGVMCSILGAVSEVGYLAWSGSTSSEALTYPIARLGGDPLIETIATNVCWWLAILDVALTLSTTADATSQLVNLGSELKTIKNELYNNPSFAQKALICSNVFLLIASFVLGSMAPGVGLKMMQQSDDGVELTQEQFISLSVLFFIGQMSIYFICYAPALCKFPQELAKLKTLSGKEKEQDLLFLKSNEYKKVVVRTALNIIYQGVSFWGLGSRIAQFVFHLDSKDNPILWNMCGAVSALLAFWRSVSLLYFTDRGKTKNGWLQTSDQENTQIEGEGVGRPLIKFICPTYASTNIVTVLAIGSFLCRELGIPPMYTGEMENPADDYQWLNQGLVSLILMVLGFGPIYQYMIFMADRSQEALDCAIGDFKKSIAKPIVLGLVAARDGLFQCCQPGKDGGVAAALRDPLLSQ